MDNVGLKPIRVCLVGFGVAAEQIHLPAYQKTHGFQIVAVVDPVGSRQEAAAQYLNSALIFPNLSEALAWGKFDMIDLSTPPAFHANQLASIAEASFHCLSEKPFLIGIDDPEGMINLFKAKKLLLWCVDEWKYSQTITRAHSLVNDGKIGIPQKLRIACLRTVPARGTPEWLPEWRRIRNFSGGGIIIDYGWHLFSVARFLLDLGKTISNLRCQVSIPLGWEVEDQAFVQFDSDDCVLNFEMSWRASCRDTSCDIKGSEGSLTFNETSLQLWNSKRKLILEESMPTVLASKTAQSIWFETTLSSLKECFVGRRDPVCNQREILWLSKIIKSCYDIST